MKSNEMEITEYRAERLFLFKRIASERDKIQILIPITIKKRNRNTIVL